MGQKCRVVAIVYHLEMRNNSVHIQLSFGCQDAGVSNVLDMVTPFTEGDKSGQPLDMIGVVVFPSLVTVQDSLCATHATAKATFSIHLTT